MNALEKLISHRGNIYGFNPQLENSPSYIEKALEAGFEVECDVWLHNEQLFLGHDRPDFLIPQEWLEGKPLWCHAKNVEALRWLLDHNMHCFWHENDSYTITSKGHIWCYPGWTAKGGIMVLKNSDFRSYITNTDLLGICSDNVFHIREALQESTPQY